MWVSGQSPTPVGGQGSLKLLVHFHTTPLPPEFLDLIYKEHPLSDNVTKFHGDRSTDLGENLAKEIKKKHHGQNRRPPVLTYERSNQIKYVLLALPTITKRTHEIADT